MPEDSITVAPHDIPISIHEDAQRRRAFQAGHPCRSGVGRHGLVQQARLRDRGLARALGGEWRIGSIDLFRVLVHWNGRTVGRDNQCGKYLLLLESADFDDGWL